MALAPPPPLPAGGVGGGGGRKEQDKRVFFAELQNRPGQDRTWGWGLVLLFLALEEKISILALSKRQILRLPFYYRALQAQGRSARQL